MQSHKKSRHNMVDLEPKSAINYIVASERADNDIDHNKSHLWITRRFAKIKGCSDPFATDIKRKFSLEGFVEFKSLRDRAYKLCFENIRVFIDDKACLGNKDIENFEIPQLSLYLSMKCPKKRMVEIEENGILIEQNVTRFLCEMDPKQSSSFDVTIKDPKIILQLFSVVGIVIVKKKGHHPLSEHPLIAGIATFKNYETSSKRPDFDSVEKTLEWRQYFERNSCNFNVETDSEIILKILSTYSRNAKKAWKLINHYRSYVIESEMGFEDFKLSLDLINVIVIESRAMRLFQLVEIENKGTIGIAEFEVALMVNDFAPYDEYQGNLSPYDVFHSFDISNCGFLNKSQFVECVKIIDSTNPKITENASQIFDQAIPKNEVGSAMDYTNFKKAWCKLINKIQHANMVGQMYAGSKVRSIVQRGMKSIDFRRKYNEIAKITLRDEINVKAFKAAKEKAIQLRAMGRLCLDVANRSEKKKNAKLKRIALIEDAAWSKNRRTNFMREERERVKKLDEEGRVSRMRQNEHHRNKMLKNKMITMNAKKRENTRIVEIQNVGEDRLDLRNLSLKKLPLHVYLGKDAKHRLSVVVDLDLSGNNFTSLPTDNFFFYMSSIRRLSLARNKIKEIPGEISNLSNLEILHLDGNDLTRLPDEIKHLSKLVVFDCSCNHIENFPREFGDMKALQIITAYSNRLSEIPDSIGDLTNIKGIDLSRNLLQSLPDTLCSLGTLLKLNLSKNSLISIPNEFGSLESLQEISLDHNQIKELPRTLKNVEKFSIGYNIIQTILIDSLGTILDLNLRKNQIEDLLPCIGGMISAQRIDASLNQIKNIASEIGLLIALQELLLRSNKIEAVPVEIGALKSLQKIDLSHNAIRRIPEEFCLLRSLKIFIISNNDLKSLPDGIGSLTNLELLNLSHNRIDHLPESTSDLKKLQSLLLSSNRLKMFPSTMCLRLQALIDLDISSNLITYLPSEIANLKSVKKINLFHNQLRSLPLEFVHLIDRCNLIVLEKNPFNNLPLKWNSRISQARCQNQSGYSSSEVMEWLQYENMIYTAAKSEWETTESLHRKLILGFNEFLHGSKDLNVSGVQSRIKFQSNVMVDDEWKTNLIPRIKRFYFFCKSHGYVPRYDYLENDEMMLQKKIEEETISRRHLSALKAKNSDIENREKLNQVYFENLSTRLVTAQSKLIQNKRYIRQTERNKLIQEIRNRESQRLSKVKFKG